MLAFLLGILTCSVWYSGLGGAKRGSLEFQMVVQVHSTSINGNEESNLDIAVGVRDRSDPYSTALSLLKMRLWLFSMYQETTFENVRIPRETLGATTEEVACEGGKQYTAHLNGFSSTKSQ